LTGLWHTFTSAAALFTHIHLGFALAALVIYLSSAYLAGARWALIIRALGATCTAWNAVVTYSAGVFVGNVTPMRTLGNDAVRIALIRMRSDASVKAATASVVYDRASELPAVGVILLIAMPTLHPSVLVIVAVALVLAVLGLVPSVRGAIAARITKWHDAIVGVPVSRGNVLAALACSMGVWLLDITRITLVAAAFGVFLTPSQAATLTAIRLVSGIAPIPGGVGVIEGTAIAGLVWFGLPVETATAITILERAILFGCGTAIGGVCLTLLGGRRVLEKRAQATAVAAAALAFIGVGGFGL
jgi:hypothetical protein